MADVGVEYVHIKALGNPKPFRDLYKSGNVEEGQRCYEEHLLGERRGALKESCSATPREALRTHVR